MSARLALQPESDAAVATALLDWLAGLLSAPMSLAAVTACRSRAGGVLFDAIAAALGRLPGITVMRAVLDGGASDEELAARLSRDYLRLFAGTGGPATVSLYESSYAGTARRLNQHATAAMEALLRRCDQAVRRDCGEPADHLAIEAGLLATLLRAGDRDGADALGRRLLAWLPHVVAASAQADPGGFHHGAVLALHDALRTLHPVSACQDSR